LITGMQQLESVGIRKSNHGLCALAVMTKAPLPGYVKTRLSPPLTSEEAAALNACFLKDTAEKIDSICRRLPAKGIGVYTPRGETAVYEGILPQDFNLLLQRGRGLGERLFHAVEDLLSYGFASVCLINSDSPTLPTASLEEAVAQLSQPGDRLVIGPAEDGGYYLIGLKLPHRRLFETIDWSTSRVLQQTIKRASELGIEPILLDNHFDVDDLTSLERLYSTLFHANGDRAYEAPHTRKFLKTLMERIGREDVWLGTDSRSD
jgi:rSAM/selenodomain-associated transferase 1